LAHQACTRPPCAHLQASSSTGTPSGSFPTTPKGNCSNAGAIVGGIVGGKFTAVVSIAAAAIFYLQRRSCTPSARFACFDACQPRMAEIPPSLSDGGTVGPSSPFILTKFSVCVSRSSCCTCVSSGLMCHLPISVHPGPAE
jgi:hypothetical protein